MTTAAGTAAGSVAFRELSAADAADVAALRDRVLASLPHPDDYVPHETEDAFLAAHLGRAGITLGVDVAGRLAGFSALTLDVTGAHLDRELRDLLLAGRPDTARDCVLAVTMLSPAVRGLGLHRRAIDLRLALARRHGRDAAVAIAAPSNVASLCNLLRQGGAVDGILDLAGGRVRYLIRIPSAPGAARSAAPGCTIAVADPERVRPWLRRGFVGRELVVIDGRPHLRLEPAREEPSG